MAKWLRRRIANPLFVGSNPTVASLAKLSFSYSRFALKVNPNRWVHGVHRSGTKPYIRVCAFAGERINAKTGSCRTAVL